MMIKTLVKHGNSFALVIEKPLLDLLGIEPGTPLKIETDGTGLRIEPVRKKIEPDRTLIRERKREHVRMLMRFISTLTLPKGWFSERQQEEIREMAREGAYSDPALPTKFEQGLLFEQILDEIFGFGPLGPYLRDPFLPNPILMHDDGTFWAGDKKLDVEFDSEQHKAETMRLIHDRFKRAVEGEFIEYSMGQRVLRVPASQQSY